MKKVHYLRRYTDIPSLLHILSTRHITLLNPENWDDRNDSHYINIYKKRIGCETILALCFTQAPETYHHWKIFGGQNCGVCIYFKKEVLVRVLKKTGVSMHMRNVKYLKMDERKKYKPDIKEYPFLKRYAYRDEKEYRVIYEAGEGILKYEIPIPIASIDKIVINPWLQQNLYEAVRGAIDPYLHNKNVKITKSTILENDIWQKGSVFEYVGNCVRRINSTSLSPYEHARKLAYLKSRYKQRSDI